MYMLYSCTFSNENCVFVHMNVIERCMCVHVHEKGRLCTFVFQRVDVCSFVFQMTDVWFDVYTYTVFNRIMGI